MSSKLHLLVVGLFVTTCGENRAVSSESLSAALADPGLDLGVEAGKPHVFQLDDGHYTFGKALPVTGNQVRVGGGTELELAVSHSAVRLSTGPGDEVKLRPIGGPRGFTSWGPGVASGATVVYASADGSAAVVERASVSGLKEDIVLTRSLGDSLRFAWELELSEGLEARLQTDGSVGIYGRPRILAGDIQAGDEKSRLLLEKARSSSKKHEQRYRIPAPTVKVASGATLDGVAHFELGAARGNQRSLILVASGLEALAYPICIDPSVVVTTAAEFGLGGNLESGVDVDSAGRIKRQKTQVGLGAWTSSTFTTGRRLHTTVAANGYLYVIGGSDGTSNLSDVQVAPLSSIDGSVGAFTATTPLPTARSGHSTVVWNGYLYVIGGRAGSDLNDVLVAPLNANGTVGPFTSTTSIPSARSGHTSVVWNGFLYVIGGLAGSYLSDIQRASLNANGTVGNFTSTTSLPSARSGHTSVVNDGILYVLGGTNGGGYFNDVQTASINADGSLDAFTATSSFSAPREGHSTVIANGCLYVLGGFVNTFSYRADVQMAPLQPNGTLGPFSDTTGFVSLRAYHGAAQWNGHLYLTGGSNGSTRFNTVLEAPLTGMGKLGTFSTTTTLPTVLTGHGTVAWNGYLYVIAGANSGGKTGQVLFAPINADGTLGAFTATASLATPRWLSSSVAWNGYLYVMGGLAGTSTYQADVQVARINADGTLNAFVATTPMPSARTGQVSVAYNGMMYVIGGYTGTTSLNDVQRAPINADGTLGTFTASNTFTNARTGHAALAYNGFLYVIGGSGSGYFNDVQVAPINANGSLGAFATTTTFSGPRYRHTAVARNGSLYILGGEDNAFTKRNDVQVAPLNVNGTLGAFTTTTPFTTARNLHSTAAYDGFVYVLGGDSGVGSLQDVQVAALNGTGRVAPFSTTTPLDTARAGHTSVVWNGFLYVIGGLAGSTLLNDVQVAPINTDGTVGAFIATSPFAVARWAHTSVAANGYLYVIGGRDATAERADVQFAPINANGTLGTFTVTNSIPGTRSFFSSAAANGYLYVVGGSSGASAFNDVRVAPINADGTLGVFASTTSFVTARNGHTSLIHGGNLYVIGGSDGVNYLGDVQFAPLNTNGTLGAFTTTAGFPLPRGGHTSLALNGYFYVIGGVTQNSGRQRDVLVAPINANGTLGAFTHGTKFLTARNSHTSVEWNGNLYVIGGGNGSHLADIQFAPTRTPAALGRYSRLVDFGAPSTAVSLTVNGTATRGLTRLEYRTAPPSGVFGPVVDKGSITLGSPVTLGGNGVRYVQVRLKFDDTQAAAVNLDATTERDATDITLVYTPDPVLAPATAPLPPKGSLTFVCSGGSGTGYVYAVSPNNSGGSINASGAYVAGATGSVTDTVTCTDSTTAAGSATVTVGPGVSTTPAALSLSPRGGQTFTASGGSNTGFTWTFVTNNSGATLSPAGVYQAGTTGSVTDTLRVTDSLLNTATVAVTVTAALSVSPASLSVAPRQTNTFTTTGGSGTGLVWSVITNNSGMTIGSSSGLYTAGVVGGVTDVIGVTDSLGNTATRSITVTAGVSLSPTSATRAPGGSQTFVASGGSGTGFAWSFFANPSGGSLGGGAYTAGTTGSVTDVVQVTDSLGNFARANVTVTAGITASPASATVTPRGTASFTASGGSGAGFTWGFQTNLSGGTLSTAGAYTAGSTGSVTDVLRVVDSFNNSATVNVTVSAGVTIAPASPSTPPLGTINFTATNGSGTGYSWAIVTSGSGAPTIGASSGVFVAGTQQGTDVVRATDSLGNTATMSVNVTNALSISPGSPTLPPRGTVTFSPSGGSGTGFVWTQVTNNSGATFNPTTRVYQAGSTGGVTDTVRVTDSLNNLATVTITVTAGVSVSPATTTRFPRESLTFTAAGGNPPGGYTWSLQTNASGGSIDPATGAYQAGRTGSVTDVVLATDSLGNTGTASVAVQPAISFPAVTLAPRAAQTLSALGGSGAGFGWTFVTNASMGTLSSSGSYIAGRTGSVVDVVEVTDSLGNVAQLSITVTAGVSITPASPTVAPRGTQLLTAAGGSGSGYSWFLTTNRSGANLSPSNGLYQAGTVAGVVDELQVVDSLGNTATAVVNVSDQLAITPALPTVAPRQALTFVAVNGAGTITWRLTSFPSGATIDSAGNYVAGPVGGTVDVVQATDSNGNPATTQVTVTASLTLTPLTLALPPRGTQLFTAAGGATDGGYTFAVTGSSGATIDATTGAYAAGPTGRTTDVVEVTDVLGNQQRATVTVTDGLVVTPGTAELTSGERQTFTAQGGSNEGFVWSLLNNPSGSTIDPGTGEYLAGEVGNVSDDVQVTDSLGNVATARVNVAARSGQQSMTPVADRSPANGWSCGCSSSGGSQWLLLALGALLLRKRRAASVGAAVACLLMVTPLRAEAAKKKAAPAKVTKPAPAPAPVVEEPAPVVTPPPAVIAAPAQARPPSIAVLDVEVTVPGEKLDGAAFSEMVVTAVDSAHTFKVISSKEIATMLGIERQKQLLGCGEESSCMTEIANALGSDYLMVASVGRVGENYLVSARLINGLTNKVTARASVQAKSANSLLEALWRATQQTLDGYGASLPAREAQAWAARPKPTPPATLIAVEETPSHFGAAVTAAFGYQPLSSAGNRASIGAQVDLTFRRGRLDLAAGVIIAPSPGGRVTATWALTETRARIDLGLRGTFFPGLGLYGGGVTSGFEFGLNEHFALNARVAVEAYPVQGTVVLALLGAAGASARF